MNTGKKTTKFIVKVRYKTGYNFIFSPDLNKDPLFTLSNKDLKFA